MKLDGKEGFRMYRETWETLGNNLVKKIRAMFRIVLENDKI